MSFDHGVHRRRDASAAERAHAIDRMHGSSVEGGSAAACAAAVAAETTSSAAGISLVGARMRSAEDRATRGMVAHAHGQALGYVYPDDDGALVAKLWAARGNEEFEAAQREAAGMGMTTPEVARTRHKQDLQFHADPASKSGGRRTARQSSKVDADAAGKRAPSARKLTIQTRGRRTPRPSGPTSDRAGKVSVAMRRKGAARDTLSRRACARPETRGQGAAMALQGAPTGSDSAYALALSQGLDLVASAPTFTPRELLPGSPERRGESPAGQYTRVPVERAVTVRPETVGETPFGVDGADARCAHAGFSPRSRQSSLQRYRARLRRRTDLGAPPGAQAARRRAIRDGVGRAVRSARGAYGGTGDQGESEGRAARQRRRVSEEPELDQGAAQGAWWREDVGDHHAKCQVILNLIGARSARTVAGRRNRAPPAAECRAEPSGLGARAARPDAARPKTLRCDVGAARLSYNK